MSDDGDSSALVDATATFLEEKPDGERALEAVLEVDAEHETWTFDDVELDSGTFGELVSRGIVEKVDGEYQLVNREIVAAVVAGEDIGAYSSDSGPSITLPSIDLGIWGDVRALLGLAGALLLVFVMRITQYGSVMRGDDVVSPGNDPYHYRYWMEELLAESTSPTDIGLLAEMPAGAMSRRPLTHALNWWFATLLGGDQWAADMVAAWLPVVASIALGVVIYALAVVVTRDPRMGIASVVLFAIAPVHVVYTQIGFLEHRLHQYFWLGVTLLALAWLAVDFTRRREDSETQEAIRGHLESPVTWLWAVVLGVALGFSVHLWGGSPLLFIPFAAYIGLRTLLDVREGISPTLANLPVLGGLVIGTVISVWMHTSWDWRLAFVAYTPAMVLGGAIAVMALGDLWRHLEIHVGGLAALEAVVAGLGVYLLRTYRPDDWAQARARADDLFLREGYTESASLFTFDYGVIFGPVIQLGVSFYLAMAILGWVCWALYRDYEPAWLLLGVYTIILTVLAGIQIRFAAQLAIPLSVLGGVGLVYVLSTLDLVRRPMPFRSPEPVTPARADGGGDDPVITAPDVQTTAYIVGIGLLICGMSLIYAPGLAGQVSYDDPEYEAVMAIEEHANETEREFPGNYVLSHWGDNRMHNYFVNGESRGYGYARSNFDDFRLDDDPDRYHEAFGDRVGYVLVTDREAHSGTVQTHLLEGLGVGEGDGEPLEHYQLLYVDDDRSVAAFALVPGATLEVGSESGENVIVSGDIFVSGESLEYERTVTVGEDGKLEVTVSNPGTYLIDGEEVVVSEEDVAGAATLEVE
ncbi:MFS transporter [Natronosalvus vescus]|uniref:MFS transporter n=1 Tax=Natronosalvus vescus TaxID=2953881 RepID=UPI002090C520|nr:MFS transporter [Natronosalvus vescus]